MVILAALPAHDVPLRPGAVLIDHRVLSRQAGDEQELQEGESYVCPEGSLHTAQAGAAV